MTDAVALALGAALAIAAVVFAARPFLRPRSLEPSAPRATPERIRLEEERDRALAALKELEFDHRTGKISDSDYRDLVGPLRAEAAQALRALDRVGAMTTRLESPPDPARVPEPWPPPDEGDLPDPAPTPAPGEPAPGPEEPAPPRDPTFPQGSGRLKRPL
jgi:hypothetical protein